VSAPGAGAGLLDELVPGMAPGMSAGLSPRLGRQREARPFHTMSM